jgi:hypothetical protein
MRLGVVLAVLVLAVLAAAASASASELVTRNAEDVRLVVDGQNRAVVFYRVGTRKFHPLYWDAVDARPPAEGVPATAFRRDYSGGFGAFRKPIWKTIRNACGPYRGEPLAWLVTACTMRDGTHWALQSWQRALPVLGRPARFPNQLAWELRLSHWSGEGTRLEVWQDWIYSVRLENLVARVTFHGQPVYGFAATPAGNPLDAYGRNVAFDAFNSSFGPGWQRANALLTHRGTGVVCAAFADADFLAGTAGVNRGRGERYRATVPGPGVAPDAFWEGATVGRFDPGNQAHLAIEAAARDRAAALGETDPRCTTE